MKRWVLNTSPEVCQGIVFGLLIICFIGAGASVGRWYFWIPISIAGIIGLLMAGGLLIHFYETIWLPVKTVIMKLLGRLP